MDLNILSSEEWEFSRENKLYIQDDNFQVGKPPKKSISNLSSVANKLRILIKENNQFSDCFINNLNKINAKIIKRNERIESNAFLKIIDLILKRWGQEGLKIEPLAIPFCQSPMSSRIANHPIASPPPVIPRQENSQTLAATRKQRVDHLYEDGMLCSINKTFNSPLIFEPDDSKMITREMRAQFAAIALLLAPPQPEDRAFEYVGFGTGSMRQDLHHVLGLIEQGVHQLHISLIDTDYEEGHRLCHNEQWDSKLCREEFEAIIRSIAPHVEIVVDLYPSAEEFLKKNENSKIDLLTAIRVEVKHENVKAGLTSLKEKMGEDSGLLITDTTHINQVEEQRCLRGKKEVGLPKGKIKDLYFVALGNLSSDWIQNDFKKRWRSAKG